MTEIKRPWGKYGTLVESDPLSEAGLHWHVNLLPQFVAINEQLIPTENFAYVKGRDHKVLHSNVGPKQNPLQNHEALDIFKQYKCRIMAAGTLKDDSLVWFLGQTNHKFNIQNETCRAHVLFTNYHEPLSKPDVRYLLIKKKSFITLSSELIAEYPRADDIDPAFIESVVIKKTNEWEYRVNRMLADGDATSLIKRVFPMSGKGKSKWDISIPARRTFAALDEMGGDTWWDAYGVICYSIDYLLGHGDRTRLESSWYGINQDRKELALKYIMQRTKNKIDLVK